MKTLVIVGAGPGLSLSLAERFGKEDFQIALIARRKAKLDAYVAQLTESNIKAIGYPADVTVESEIIKVFTEINAEFGQVDVLIYNAARVEPNAALQTTANMAAEHMQVNVIGGVRCTEQILPEMRKRNEGTILFTGGGSAGLTALPIVTPLSMGKSALRSYVHCLHAELKDSGVFAGMLSVEGVIKPGTFYAPDKIAEAYYDFYMQQETVEVFYNQDNFS